MKNKKESFIRSAIPWLILGGILGIILPIICSIKIEYNVKSVFTIVGYTLIGLSSVICLLAVILIVKSKRQLKDNKDEDYLDKIEKRLDIATIVSAVSLLTAFLSFGILNSVLKSDTLSIGEGIATIIFIIICLLTSYLQYKIVNIIKEINPEKKGNPMKLNFNKDWYNSCDEAQKQIIGEASYKTYTITSSIFILMFLIIILISKFIDIGIFSIILIAAVNIINTVVYGIISIKIEHKSLE